MADNDLDELLEEIKTDMKDAMVDGVRHGLGLAIAALDYAAALDEPVSLQEVAHKLRQMSAAFEL